MALVQRNPTKESIMKCSTPDCNRGIGLVCHWRGWFGKERYCSRQCRDALVPERPKRVQQERSITTYFEWLFLQSIASQQRKLISVGDPLPGIPVPGLWGGAERQDFAKSTMALFGVNAAPHGYWDHPSSAGCTKGSPMR
jgi:hypothetical protein